MYTFIQPFCFRLCYISAILPCISCTVMYAYYGMYMACVETTKTEHLNELFRIKLFLPQQRYPNSLGVIRFGWY